MHVMLSSKSHWLSFIPYSFVQPNPKPFTNPNFNHNKSIPVFNLTSIYILPLNLNLQPTNYDKIVIKSEECSECPHFEEISSLCWLKHILGSTMLYFQIQEQTFCICKMCKEIQPDSLIRRAFSFSFRETEMRVTRWTKNLLSKMLQASLRSFFNV